MSQHELPAPHFTTPPDAETIAALAERAVASIPARLRRHVQNLGITVEDLAADELLAEMGIESAWELTGLYQGTPLGERSMDDIMRLPDRIVLYRLVRNVVIHEIAHHFGFSDAEIEALEQQID